LLFLLVTLGAGAAGLGERGHVGLRHLVEQGAIAKALIMGKIVQVVFTYREKLPGNSFRY
jgi:hypothetical protein